MSRDISQPVDITRALLHHSQVVGRDLRKKGFFAAPLKHMQLDLFGDMGLSPQKEVRKDDANNCRKRPSDTGNASGEHGNIEVMTKKLERIDRVMDRINDRFGRAVVSKATLASPERD